MFHVLRYRRVFLAAGMIGMLAGMAGQIYTYEFSDINAVLMQEATVFRELDELAFLVAMASIIVFMYFVSCWNTGGGAGGKSRMKQ